MTIEITLEYFTKELEKLLKNEDYKSQIKKDFAELQNVLGGKGASARTAKIIYSSLN